MVCMCLCLHPLAHACARMHPTGSPKLRLNVFLDHVPLYLFIGAGLLTKAGACQLQLV